MSTPRIVRVNFSFPDTINKIRTTAVGKEAAMYGPLRDLFIQLLGYPAADVDIDVTGDGGRPDVTVRAPSGLVDSSANPIKISWIVLEAKDEVFEIPELREETFAEKAKYIGTNTAWFVTVDPSVFIARRIGSRDCTFTDLTVRWSDLDGSDQFLKIFASLQANIAGFQTNLDDFVMATCR